MVQLSARSGPGLLVLQLVTGLAGTAIGVAVVSRADSALGVVGASILVIGGVIVLATMSLLGGWCAALGIVGALQASWLWPVLAVVPACYFLGFPVLAAVGRFRPAGVWLTPTRIVDEQFGIRSEIALADVDVVLDWDEKVVLMPRAPSAVRRRRLTPRPWRAREHPDRLEVSTTLLPGGSAELATAVRDRLGAVR